MTQNEQKKFLIADNIKAVVVSLIVVIIVSGALGLFIFSVIHEQEESRAEEILSDVRIIFKDAEYALDHLNSLGFQACSDENLSEMRRTLFRSRFVKEIGFFGQKKLLCSTYLGILANPIDEAIPDFYTALGDAFWINTPLELFDNKAKGTIAKRDRYNAVLDMEGVIGLSYTQDWQLFYKGEKFYHIAGNEALFSGRTEIDESALHPIYFSLQFIKCDALYTDICIRVRTDHGRLFELHKGKLVLFICVMLMTAALSHILTFNYHRRRRSLDSRIRRGLKSNKFYCLYQPLVNLNTGDIIGCEVLSRFEDEFGSIYPDEFIQQIRAQNKTWEFTEIMMASAMTSLNANAEIPDGFKVSFNLFPSDFMREELLDLDWVMRMNTKQFILVLEITEDEQLATISAVKHIKALKSRGFQIAIDDFGVGYSNLSQLKTLKCDFLKIDRSFVMDMEDHSIRSSLIPYIVSIAQGLQATLIAEGVENLDQASALLNLEVDFGQGWLFGKPQPLEQLAQQLKVTAH